jgi:hypothetical protein
MRESKDVIPYRIVCAIPFDGESLFSALCSLHVPPRCRTQSRIGSLTLLGSRCRRCDRHSVNRARRGVRKPLRQLPLVLGHSANGALPMAWRTFATLESPPMPAATYLRLCQAEHDCGLRCNPLARRWPTLRPPGTRNLSRLLRNETSNLVFRWCCQAEQLSGFLFNYSIEAIRAR